MTDGESKKNGLYTAQIYISGAFKSFCADGGGADTNFELGQYSSAGPGIRRRTSASSSPYGLLSADNADFYTADGGIVRRDSGLRTAYKR
ncbi:hypothetical protein ES703_56431 [subsurface metagenome]